MLWYKASWDANGKNRDCVAASVSYFLSKRYISFASKFLRTNAKLSRVLYFQSIPDDAPPKVDHTDFDALAIDPMGIVSALICQAILLDCENIAVLERRILMLTIRERETFQSLLRQGHEASMDELLMLFVKILRFTDPPDAIAIDNIHAIDASKAVLLLSGIRKLFDKEFRTANVELQIIFSGVPSTILSSCLSGVPFIDDDTERNGMNPFSSNYYFT